MLIHIQGVLTPAQVVEFRKRLDVADWIDGKVTAGYQSAKSKNNLQLPEDALVGREIGEEIINALQQNALFMAAALPLKVFPPLFNRYDSAHSFGNHVDNAIRQVKGSPHRVRTDLAATLFLVSPGEYDGGELLIDDTYGAHSVKLDAGDLVLYPASSLHQVRPITRGVRLASFFWIQSMIRDDSARTLLFDLDSAIQRLNNDTPGNPALLQLTSVYHNLLRRWADV